MGGLNRLFCLRLLPLFLSFVIVAVWGCGGSGTGGGLVPVTGKVTVGGKAVTRGSVSFRADKARGNTSTVEPYGTIGADGTYTLFTNNQKGAPLGKYVVLVEASEDVDPKKPSATPKPLIDPKYADPDKPILQVDVVENPQPGQYDLTIPK